MNLCRQAAFWHPYPHKNVLKTFLQRFLKTFFNFLNVFNWLKNNFIQNGDNGKNNLLWGQGYKTKYAGH